MIIDLSIHFTNKCNYKCEHCMFSCGNDIQEDRDRVFNLAKEIKYFLKGYNYRLILSGGESFLDIQLIKEYIDNLINENCISFGIPTNGYFLNNEKLLEQIDNLFIEKTNTKENSKIIISTSKYHQKQWSKSIKNIINNIHILIQYENLYNLLEVQNTFTTQALIPYGRAKEYGLRCTDKHVKCDLFEFNKNLEICISPNGDISFCDFGYVIGNVKNITINEIKNIRDISLNKNKNKIFRNSKYICEKCRKGRYVYAV